MVGWPSEEDRIQTIKQMTREKKAYIGFLKESLLKDENEKIKKVISKEIEKKQEELEKFIKDNPLEEEPEKELSNVDVPLNPRFQNDGATPELWNPEEIKKNSVGLDDVVDYDYFDGYLKLECGRGSERCYNNHMSNILSLTPGLGYVREKCEIIIDNINIDSILYRTLDSENRLKYQIYKINDKKSILIPRETSPGVYFIDSRFDLHATVAAPINIPPYNTGYRNFPKLQAVVAGFFDARNGCSNGDLRLITVKTEDDFLYASPIIGVKLSGLVHVN